MHNFRLIHSLDFIWQLAARVSLLKSVVSIRYLGFIFGRNNMGWNKSQVGCCLWGSFTIYYIQPKNIGSTNLNEVVHRLADVLIEQIIEKVHDIILTGYRTKVREVAVAVVVSQESAINILHDNLRVRKVSVEWLLLLLTVGSGWYDCQCRRNVWGSLNEIRWSSCMESATLMKSGYINIH